MDVAEVVWEVVEGLAPTAALVLVLEVALEVVKGPVIKVVRAPVRVAVEVVLGK